MRGRWAKPNPSCISCRARQCRFSLFVLKLHLGRCNLAEHCFPDRLRLPLDFDPVRLAADMIALSASGWIAHFVTQNYDGDWSVIPLRGPAGARHPVQMIYSDPACTAFADTPLLAAAPYLQEVLASLDCPLLAVRLMRLSPGSVIKEHRDHDLAFEDGTVRIHIPVTTNDAVDFRLNGTRCLMPAGSAWYLRLADPHSVSNRGDSDRVHLVIDATVNEWVRGLLERAKAAETGRAA
jgi:aspartyl/asparaginyl beta-hydroxylase